MQRYNNVTTLAIPKNKVLNPNRFIRPQCSKILAVVLFPNRFCLGSNDRFGLNDGGYFFLL